MAAEGGGDIYQWMFLPEMFKAIGLYVPHHVLYSWFFIVLLVLVGWLATRNMTMVPRGPQNFFEFLIKSIEDFVVANMGEPGRKVFPVLFTLLIYIWVLNVSGLVPSIDAATANINTTACMALFVFVYYNYWGVRIHGAGYIKKFMGPYWWFAPVMFPIEIVSHLARPLSLSLRLFGNIKAEELTIIVMFLLAPIIGSLPIFFLFLLLKTLQAFVFFMLTMMYLKEAFEEAH